MRVAPLAPSARPCEILATMGRAYPHLWPAVDRLRATRADDFPGWPDWCFLPMQGAYAILSGGGDRRVPLDRIHHVGIVAALAAWQAARGVYRFDPTVAEALAATPLDGELPTDLLYRLPGWSVYEGCARWHLPTGALGALGLIVCAWESVDCQSGALRWFARLP
jgi:hypothetical protein